MAEGYSIEQECLFKSKGSIDTNLYHVVSGSLQVFVEGEFEEHIIRFGYAGDFITALDSFITKQP